MLGTEERRMTKYGIHVDLGVRATDDEIHETVAAQVEVIVEHLIDLETSDCGLKDSTIALDLGSMSVEAELTVEADTRGVALDRPWSHSCWTTMRASAFVSSRP
jgi:hypothetical protein